MMVPRWALLLALAAPAGAQPVPAAATKSDPLAGFDEFVTKVMKDWEVPGLAVAVIRKNKVVLAKGYGFRDLEQKRPATSKTLFAIGSISKSFTVTTLCMLADEGKLKWNEPVRTYLADFRLHDKTATEQMTALDLVTHRSGLPRHDRMWYLTDLSRQQIYGRLRHLKPSASFRGAWQYNNLMFMTAGILTQKLSGQQWEEFVRGRIFTPLGMARSNLSVDVSQKSDDFARPYNRKKGADGKETVSRVPFFNLDDVGPAGSINSCVDDMIHYVQMHLNLGRVKDGRLLSAAQARKMQTPHSAIPGPLTYKELGHRSYGMGFFIGTYQGELVVEHGGAIDGFTANLAMLPRQWVGLIVLNNLGRSPLPQIVSRNLFDRFLGKKPVDWSDRLRKRQAAQKRAAAVAKKKGYTGKKPGTRSSHAPEEYAGHFEHAAYGRVRILVQDGKLTWHYGSQKAGLSHFHYDVFEVNEGYGKGMKLTFGYDKLGDIDRVMVPLEASVDDIVFRRVPDPAMQKKEFLQRFTGRYSVSGQRMTARLNEAGQLTLVVANQPVHRLVPFCGNRFDFVTPKGYSVVFKEKDGKVVEMVLNQRGKIFVARRISDL